MDDTRKTSGPPVPLNSSGQVALQNNIGYGCQAITDNGTVCGESKSLKIIEEFQHLYEERLRRIDEEAAGDGMQLKLKTLRSWVHDLGEQNAMLVQTVEQLEREAADRVALLEERLQRSSHIALEYMTKLQDYDNQIKEITGEKVHSESLEIKASARLMLAQQTEEILRGRVSNLQNDITGLLELIRRARQDGSWHIDGLNFREVTYEDIFGTYPYKLTGKDETIMQMQAEINTLKKSLREASQDFSIRKHDVLVLQEKVAQQENDMLTKDAQIKKLIEKIQNLRDNISLKYDEEAAGTFDSKTKIGQMEIKIAEIESDIKKNHLRLQRSLDKLHSSVQSRKLSTDDIDNHRHLLEESHKIFQALLKKISDLLRNSLEYMKKIDDLECVNSNLKQTVGSYHSDLNETHKIVESQKSIIKKLQESLNEYGVTFDADKTRVQKKGVSFSTPSVPENENVQQMRTEVKATPKQTSVAEESIESDLMVPARLNFAKEIAEFRVKTVIAQAALEEMKDEFDKLLENLEAREEKIEKLGDMMQGLHNTLTVPEADRKDVHNEHHSEAVKEQGKTVEIVEQEFAECIENMGAWERKISDDLQLVLNVESNLVKLHLQLKSILSNKEEYVSEKEVFNETRKSSERKLEKLHEELESVQDDMQQCIEALQPSEESNSD